MSNSSKLSDHLSQLAWTLLGRARIKIPELFNCIEQVITQCHPLAMTESQTISLMRGFVEAEEGSSELFNHFSLAIIKDTKSLSSYDICEVP